MLATASEIGFCPVHGTELVSSLIDGERVVKAYAHDLPFAGKSFDVVTMFDVIEHLLPGDDMAACHELRRVARKHVLITANNHSSRNKDGDDLHINRRDYSVWNDLFRGWFAGADLTWLRGRGRNGTSEAWRIDL
jgi:ubiquinone/menaquinone biosynthesis C-methylase UbiE